MKNSNQRGLFGCVFVGAIILLSACNYLPDQETPIGNNESYLGMNMDHGIGMMSRHHADPPELYAGKVNLVNKDEKSIERGGVIYQIQCESCHGEYGFGDGAAGLNLDPAPAPIGMTSLMLSDEYLFWRISEGGAPFGTAMPSFESILDEKDRWDVINYLRHLGIAAGMMDEELDPSFGEQSMSAHMRMVEEAIQEELITPDDGQLFLTIHSQIEAFILNHPELISPEGMDNNLDEILKGMLAEGVIKSGQADIFQSVHKKLNDAGLMQ